MSRRCWRQCAESGFGSVTRTARLGELLAQKSKGIVPANTPDSVFELYSVPSFEARMPEIVKGSEIGSNKQIVVPGTVLLCKINPRINRAWVVGSFSQNEKIASTEWITFPPHNEVEPKYLSNFLSQEFIRQFLAANASGVGGSLTRVKASTVEDIEVTLPPVEKQRRIVAEIEKAVLPPRRSRRRPPARQGQPQALQGHRPQGRRRRPPRRDRSRPRPPRRPRLRDRRPTPATHPRHPSPAVARQGQIQGTRRAGYRRPA